MQDNNLIGAQVFGKAKNHKPTWTQNNGFVSCVGKTQILIEFLDRTQKSTASRQKKVS